LTAPKLATFMEFVSSEMDQNRQVVYFSWIVFCMGV